MPGPLQLEVTYTLGTKLGSLAVFFLLQGYIGVYKAFQGGVNRPSYFGYWVAGSVIGLLGYWVALIVLPQIGV